MDKNWKTMENTQQYMRPREVAKLMGVTHQTVKNLISRGVLVGKNIGGSWYINKADIEAVMPKAADFDTLTKRMEKAEEDMRRDAEETERKLQEQEQESRKRLQEETDYYSVLDFLRSSRWERETVKTFIGKLGFEYLTTRETEVLTRLCDGASIETVAGDLGILPGSLYQIFRKALAKMEGAPNVSDMLFDYKETKELCSIVSGQYAKALATIADLRRQLGYQQESEKPPVSPEEAANMAELLLTPVKGLGLSRRALNCLASAGVETLYDLVQHKDTDLLRFRNFGMKTLNELDDLVCGYGLGWGMDLKPYIKALAKEKVIRDMVFGIKA